MAANFEKLPTRASGSLVRVVVEAPRGSKGKFAYDPETRTFTLSKSLMLGLSYPFDWGFIPSTVGEDGDPLDALALHDVPTFPGVVLLCEVIGLVRLTQRQGKRREANHRILVLPINSKRAHEVDDARDLPRELRHELEDFFIEVDAEEPEKAPRLEGWGGPKEALKLIHKGERLHQKRAKKGQ